MSYTDVVENKCDKIDNEITTINHTVAIEDIDYLVQRVIECVTMFDKELKSKRKKPCAKPF